MVTSRVSCVLLAVVLGVAVAQDEQRTGHLYHHNGGYDHQAAAHGHLAQVAAAISNAAAALHPANVASNIASRLPHLPLIGHKIKKHKEPLPPVTSTMYIQVTKTQTKYPVCMATASAVLPPCKVLSPPTENHHDQHYDAGSAFHVGQGVGVLGQQLLTYPQLAQLAAYGAVPQGYAEYDQHVLNEQWHNQVREQLYPELPELEEAASEIKPTAVPKMPEATATVESSRPKRDVEETEEADAETENLKETKPLRPQARYIQGFGRPSPVEVPQVTKTVYVTKVEKVIDSHVTATVVPSNCIPDHVPLCPVKYQHKPQHHYQPHPAPVHTTPKPYNYNSHKNGHYKGKPKDGEAPIAA